MPQLHPTRRTGRRLLTAGLLSAVVILGTPAVASADPLTDAQQQLEEGLGGLTGGALTGGTSTGGTGTGTGGTGTGGTGTGGTGGTGTGGTGTTDPLGSIQAGADCVGGLVKGIQVQVGQIAGGLTGLLVGLAGGSTTTVGAEQSATLPMSVQDLLDLLSPDQLADLLAGGQQSLTVGIPLVVGGVAGIVPVVFEFVNCLASLIPAATPTTVAPAYTPPAPAPATTTVDPAITTSAAPTQAVVYPGYAPTGGAPTEDDGSPAALVGLGLLTAATGGGALWLRARRGVA